jgi:capsid protein
LQRGEGQSAQVCGRACKRSACVGCSGTIRDRSCQCRQGSYAIPVRNHGISRSRRWHGQRYDAARNAIAKCAASDDDRRNWWSTDYMSAKAANSFAVRRTLRMRSRYEVSNNPYLFGICNSNADDLIGAGPTLQVQTTNAAYNREVETAWAEWCAEVELAEKIRTCKLANPLYSHSPIPV